MFVGRGGMKRQHDPLAAPILHHHGEDIKQPFDPNGQGHFLQQLTLERLVREFACVHITTWQRPFAPGRVDGALHQQHTFSVGHQGNDGHLGVVELDKPTGWANRPHLPIDAALRKRCGTKGAILEEWLAHACLLPAMGLPVELFMAAIIPTPSPCHQTPSVQTHIHHPVFCIPHL
jgi:hypothetical protein